MHADPSAPAKEDVMLSSRFRDPGQRLFFARALLFPNRIEFSGMALSGMYRRLLLLENVEQVEWRAGQARASNLTFWLRDGGKMQLWMNTAGLWKYMIDANMRNLSMQLPAAASASVNWGPETQGV
jgi:hypothetical protein